MVTTCRQSCAQCDQVWQNLPHWQNSISFWLFLSVYSVFGKNLNQLWQILNGIGQIFNIASGHVRRKRFGHLVTLVVLNSVPPEGNLGCMDPISTL